MNKKITFSARPPSVLANESQTIPDQAAIDAWVNNEPVAAIEPVKRFTFEVPQSLHKRIKMTCAAQDRQMADVIREMLEKQFPPE
jgi:hypothetical protein